MGPTRWFYANKRKALAAPGGGDPAVLSGDLQLPQRILTTDKMEENDMKYLLGICLGFLTAFCLAGVVNAGDCADASLSIAIVDEAIVESADLSALDGIDSPRESIVYVARGDIGEATVYAAIVSNGIVGGVQGWSLSALVTGGAITGANLDGTSGADVSAGGVRSVGFEKTEVVDPARNEGATGAVSAVVLSFTMPVTLSGDGTAGVLNIDIATSEPQGDEPQTVNVGWRDGMIGAGQPVANVATVSGATADFCTCQAAAVTFELVVYPSFLRCDPNDDGQSDIADAIFIVNSLFRGAAAATCLASVDCNGDGLNDVSDALYNIAYRFSGGPAPGAPYPACGQDGDVDCEASICGE